VPISISRGIYEARVFQTVTTSHRRRLRRFFDQNFTAVKYFRRLIGEISSPAKSTSEIKRKPPLYQKISDVYTLN